MMWHYCRCETRCECVINAKSYVVEQQVLMLSVTCQRKLIKPTESWKINGTKTELILNISSDKNRKMGIFETRRSFCQFSNTSNAGKSLDFTRHQIHLSGEL